MELKYKPDFERAKGYWRAFWRQTIIDRPCVNVYAPKDGVGLDGWLRERDGLYMAGSDGDLEGAVRRFDAWAARTYFGGEAIPCMDISFGPDQFAAFVGAELDVADDGFTSWAKPFVKDWCGLELTLRDEPGSVWRRMQDFLRFVAEFGEGKFLVRVPDLHSNFDCLCAIRGPHTVCLDLYDCPDAVEQAMLQLRGLYPLVYEKIHELGDMTRRGSLGTIPLYSEGRSATVQCDFICIVGPEHARRFVIPAIAEEMAYLEHSVYHYDGPVALVHLHNILAIPDLDVVQWQPGAGQPRSVEWMDVLHKIQDAGKAVWEYDWTIEEVKQHFGELRPEALCLNVIAESVQEADDFLAWLKANS